MCSLLETIFEENPNYYPQNVHPQNTNPPPPYYLQDPNPPPYFPQDLNYYSQNSNPPPPYYSQNPDPTYIRWKMGCDEMPRELHTREKNSSSKKNRERKSVEETNPNIYL